MNRNQGIALTVIVVVILAWAVLTWVVLRQPTTPSVISLTAGNATSTVQSSATSTAPSDTSTGATTAGAIARPVTEINPPTAFVTPTAQAQWVLGTNNTIQWNHPANIAGNVYLVNATNGAIVGWILQQSSPTQVLYPWDTSDVFLSKTSPVKKDISAGSYIIKAVFNSPEDPTITSAPFSIIYPSQVQSTTYTVNVTNGTFAPSSLTIQPDNTIVFINHDAVAYPIVVSSFGQFTLAPYSAYTFNTASLASTTYSLYSNSTPQLRMILTVK